MSTGKARGGARWSQEVTAHSDALDLEPGVFTRTPAAMARSLAASAERSTRRKASSPFRSAMSMLVFYANRAGHALPAERRRAIEQAKDELRALYGRPRRGRVTAGRRRSPASGRRARTS